MKKINCFKHICLCVLSLVSCLSTAIAAPKTPKIFVDRITCEYMDAPQVIDALSPRLSWINNAVLPDERGISQSAYQILVASDKKLLKEGNADLWDSGKIKSDKSTLVPYSGEKLESFKNCYWKVRVWDNKGVASNWSDVSEWHMGILSADGWKAQWIGAPWQTDAPESKTDPKPTPPAPFLRKCFSVDKAVRSARIYTTGLGYFELYVNGAKVSSDVLVPNQTNYDKREGLYGHGIPVEDNFTGYSVLYLGYDVTSLLKNGKNAIGTVLGNGFFNSVEGWTSAYGTPRFIGQLHIKYEDGTEDVVCSDGSWKASQGPIRQDHIYNGEHYDANYELDGWATAEYDDSAWENVAIRKAPYGRLVAHTSPADKVNEVLKPVKIELIEPGKYRVDFGQEISGWVHLKNIKSYGKKQTIDIKYISESKNGKNSYTTSAEKTEPQEYSTRFTWYVFREVEISGYPGDLRPEDIQAEAVYTSLDRTGRFECSNEMFNTLNNMFVRTFTDNIHGGIMSDCPHRERSGYTGDGQLACRSAMHNMHAPAFYNKWIKDIREAQNVETGYVPNGAPWQPGCGGGVPWGSAITVMPWNFYLQYGDKDMIEYTFEPMKNYVGYLKQWEQPDGTLFQQAPRPDSANYWMNLGDWSPASKFVDISLVHTFYYWNCADIISKSAVVLGQMNDAAEYRAMADKIKAAFIERYYDKEKKSFGQYGANVFALRMGLSAEMEKDALTALCNDIRANGMHLDMGMYAVGFFFELLAEYDMQDFAYEVMNGRTMPSFGYWAEQGSTTMWEQFDGVHSHNHPMFGSGLIWFYRNLAGMQSDESNPGYKHIIIAPKPTKELSYASYSTLTPYGEAYVRWDKDKNGGITVDVNIPIGSTATVVMPSGFGSVITENGAGAAKTSGVKKINKTDKGYEVEVVSGKYSFNLSK